MQQYAETEGPGESPERKSLNLLLDVERHADELVAQAMKEAERIRVDAQQQVTRQAQERFQRGMEEIAAAEAEQRVKIDQEAQAAIEAYRLQLEGCLPDEERLFQVLSSFED
ncbi:MAG: hypothetical protein QHH01_02235 [Spirochaetales bacterium]|nr:hypothetical protein [Spirochaetales bacterium]